MAEGFDVGGADSSGRKSLAATIGLVVHAEGGREKMTVTETVAGAEAERPTAAAPGLGR